MSDSSESLKPDTEVTDSELQNELGNLKAENEKLHTELGNLGNLKAENEKLRADYAALLESSTAVTKKLREEVQELRSQLQTEKTRGEEMWEELSDTEQTLAEVRSENSHLQKTCDKWRSELSDLEEKLAAAPTENPKSEQKSAPGVELPEVANLLNQLKGRRKKSRADLGDMEVVLGLLGHSGG